ncbi:RNA methyltransferase [filamentous cyanobacterium LEGE 11480]|uniref:RNA methyltransferase n=1 Tax=Romeriopsis navalis LEGE 11480 TaxID=2777977 RepID=A0A928VR68_9CYAN|nr:TrmH family RNA methyltransferase [Romeriopsis navalis]MBE9030644.1 RNA methyltransferase [Romeriopsis navalis LEGE 11480]
MQFVFILVEPEEAPNVGAAARALNVMGHTDLRFVRPKADHLSEKARVLAHGSQHVLEAATVYDDLKDALHDIDLACATTARHRLEKHHYVSIRELPQVLNEKGDSLQTVAIVFGGERSGLNRQDIALCDILTTIPQSCTYPSLNLAQAVMVLSFVFSEAQTEVQIADQRLNSEEMPPAQYGSLKDSTLQLMDRIGLNDRYKTYVMKGLARLKYEDLYLLHNLRSSIDRALDKAEGKPSSDGKS